MASFLRAGEKLLIGVIHLLPLPGSPRWGGQFQAIIDRAVSDAAAYEEGGARALIIENFGDLPFTKSGVPPETVAAMAVAAREVRRTTKLAIGFNVLRNDPAAALALCAACDGQFIRVNVHIGVMLTDQGIIEGNAFETVRLRNQLAPGAEILADVHVKHAVTLGDWPIEQAARDTLERGMADGLIVSGQATGHATDLDQVKRVRKACPDARLILGSGVTAANVTPFLPYIDAVIVGTSLKAGGKVQNAVDPTRVRTLAKAMSAR
jgi:membrane complex biogenesis BtpA family protein